MKEGAGGVGEGAARGGGEGGGGGRGAGRVRGVGKKQVGACVDGRAGEGPMGPSWRICLE